MASSWRARAAARPASGGHGQASLRSLAFVSGGAGSLPESRSDKGGSTRVNDGEAHNLPRLSPVSRWKPASSHKQRRSRPHDRRSCHYDAGSATLTGTTATGAQVVVTRPASSLSQHRSSPTDRRQLTQTLVRRTGPARNEVIAGRMHLTGVALTRVPVLYAQPAVTEVYASRAAATGSNNKVNAGLVPVTGVA